MSPNFLVVGGSRCATTYIFKVLCTHPEIFMHPDCEIHFFDRHFDKGFPWYFNHFEGRSEKVVGEKTPAYLYVNTPTGIPIPEAIYSMNPNAKILISLRDPVQRSVSHYYKLIRDGKIQQTESANLLGEMRRVETTDSRIISDSLYSEKVKAYLDRFPSDQVKIVLHDDIQTDPIGTFREIYDFLDVAEDFESPLLSAQINTTRMRGIRAFSPRKLHQALIKLGCNRLAKIMFNLLSRDSFKVDEKTHTYLLERFSTDIDNLAALLGRDLSSWKRGGQAG